MSIGKVVFSGISLGLLTGILVGMSSSPVAGILVGGVLTFALNRNVNQSKVESSDRTDERSQAAISAGVFGIACIIAIFIGLYVRTHNIVSPSIDEQLERWTAKDNYSLPEAKMIVAAHAKSADASKLVSSALFSLISKDESMDGIHKPDMLDLDWPHETLIRNIREIDRGCSPNSEKKSIIAPWVRLADAMEKFDETGKKNVLTALRVLFEGH